MNCEVLKVGGHSRSVGRASSSSIAVPGPASPGVAKFQKLSQATWHSAWSFCFIMLHNNNNNNNLVFFSFVLVQAKSKNTKMKYLTYFPSLLRLTVRLFTPVGFLGL
jgi:hypothetical protein